MASLKYSRQRESIKEFLMTRTDHPTADTVYHQLRKIYPNISLGTVYRNLALLADIGEIQKICTGDGADRFDGQIKPHYHVICTRCHQVMDLDLDYMKEPELWPRNILKERFWTCHKLLWHLPRLSEKRYDVNVSCVVRNKIENQKIFKIILTIRKQYVNLISVTITIINLNSRRRIA